LTAGALSLASLSAGSFPFSSPTLTALGTICTPAGARSFALGGTVGPGDDPHGVGYCWEGYAERPENGELPRAAWKRSGEKEAATEAGLDWKGEPGPPS
jgi:hypothetical protein